MRALLLLAPMFATAACTQTSQLRVQIDSDLMADVEPPVAGDAVLRAVRVTVCDGSCDDASARRDERHWAISRRATAGRIALPFSFGLAPPEHDASRRVELRVAALRSAHDGAGASDVLFETRRLLGFQPGRTVDVPIFLAAGCVGLACPAGTTCGADGECVGIEEPLDGGVPMDAGFVCTTPPGGDAGGFPGSPELRSDRGLAPGGSVTALAIGEEPGTVLVGGFSTTAFTWEGTSSPAGAYFVSRMRNAGGAAWTTLISYGGERLFLSHVNRLVERDGRVYGVGLIGEQWTLGSLVAEQPNTGSASDSRRVGVAVFALDGSDGAPLWIHTLKHPDVTDWASGIAVDETGLWVAWHAFGGAVGATIEMDRAGLSASVDRRGVLGEGRAHLAHFTPEGVLDSIHGVQGRFIHDADVVALGDGDVVFAVVGALEDLEGIAPAPPGGLAEPDIAIARLAPSGEARWASRVSCASGEWDPWTGRLSASAGRVWLAWSTEASSPCAEVRVTERSGASISAMRAPSSAMLGAVALTACEGAGIDGTFWSASVNANPFAAVTGLSSDARGAVFGGYFGVGGANLGGGMLSARDVGTGTDSFVVAIGQDGEHEFSALLGGTGAGTTVDDGVESLVVDGDALHVALAQSAMQPFRGGTIAPGGRLLRFTITPIMP